MGKEERWNWLLALVASVAAMMADANDTVLFVSVSIAVVGALVLNGSGWARASVSTLRSWLQEPDYGRWRERKLLKLYEAAFLVHDKTPPPVDEHGDIIPSHIKETKDELHAVCGTKALPCARHDVALNGYTKWVELDDLREYYAQKGEHPEFLFPGRGG